MNSRLQWLFKKKHIRVLPEYKNSADKSSVIHLKTVNDISDVNQHLDNLFNNPPQNLAFRGVNNASFKLFSTIQRRWYWDGLDDIYADVPSYIQHQINKARSNKCIMGNLSQDNDYNLLALIQHFRGNSNLVDFSYSPVSAFFFAWDKYKDKYPHDGSLNDYVSLYVVNYTHPELGGPIEMNHYGSQTIERMVSKSGIPAERIDAVEALQDLVSIPYKKLCDGKIVQGGQHANVRMSIPYFNFDEAVQVTNANIAAQNGCFIQAHSGEIPLLEYINHINPYAPRLLWCYDIHKSLVEDICKRYGVPQNSDVIYPQRKAMDKLYQSVMELDKHVFREWALNGFRKIYFDVKD
jgi:hypothetical protein